VVQETVVNAAITHKKVLPVRIAAIPNAAGVFARLRQ
jgi:hypothetical protein